MQHNSATVYLEVPMYSMGPQQINVHRIVVPQPDPIQAFHHWSKCSGSIKPFMDVTKCNTHVHVAWLPPQSATGRHDQNSTGGGRDAGRDGTG